MIILKLQPIIEQDYSKLPDYTFSKVNVHNRVAWTDKMAIAFGEDPGMVHRDLNFCLIGGYMAQDKKGNIIGTNCFQMRCGVPSITHLWVSEPYRRHRIGWTLLNLSVMRAKKNDYYDLYARIEDNNISAITFFKNFGFKETI
jgi:GNAT superfamily N-acetyltransferase